MALETGLEDHGFRCRDRFVDNVGFSGGEISISVPTLQWVPAESVMLSVIQGCQADRAIPCPYIGMDCISQWRRLQAKLCSLIAVLGWGRDGGVGWFYTETRFERHLKFTMLLWSDSNQRGYSNPRKQINWIFKGAPRSGYRR